MRPAIVLPTIRSQEFVNAFLTAWEKEFEGCTLIVVEDRPEKLLELPKGTLHFDWSDIEKDLGEDSWIIPRRTDCVRSYGYYKAWQLNPLFILTLDDDTYPESPGHVQAHYNALFNTRGHAGNYFNTLKHDLPRGFIPGELSVGINHGGWVKTPDFDAVTQIAYRSQKELEVKDFNEGVIPSGAHYSMCGMNLSWRPEHTPLMYFGLQGNIMRNGRLEKLPIDRCGDIWCGFYSKYHLDAQGVGVTTGPPYVIHDRASNPWSNHEKERNANEMQPQFLKWLEGNPQKGDYWEKLSEAYRIWGTLFE